jgi:hypothetical protein
MGIIAIIITGMVLGFAGSVLLLVHKWVKNDHEIEKLTLQKEVVAARAILFSGRRSIIIREKRGKSGHHV